MEIGHEYQDVHNGNRISATSACLTQTKASDQIEKYLDSDI